MGKFRCSYEVPPSSSPSLPYTHFTLLHAAPPHSPSQDTAEDILCIFPQGAISTRSAWELDSLAAKLDKERGQHPLPRVRPSSHHPTPTSTHTRSPQGNVSLGSWTLEPSERFVRVHNLHQEQNYLYLTEYGYVFADSLGRVFICRG